MQNLKIPARATPGFQLRRGTNISRLFLEPTTPLAERAANFTRKDIQCIANFGLDHIRFPISEREFWSPSGEISNDHFKLLEARVSTAIKEGLRVILCLHNLRSHPCPPIGGKTPLLFSKPDEVETFRRRWICLSEAFSHIPCQHLAYELLNEPVAGKDHEWNGVWQAAHAELRSREPDRTLVIGSNHFQIPDRIRNLDLPANDPNLIASFHFYYPILFTHYRASWLPSGSYDGPVQYPGRTVPQEAAIISKDAPDSLGRSGDLPVSKQLFLKIVSNAVEAGRKNGHVVHCGEFGCIDTLPLFDRARWYRDVVDIFNERKIPWTCWDWKGEFGILDKDSWSPSGIHDALGLKHPRRIQLTKPLPPLKIRVRRRLKRIAQLLGLFR